MRVNISHVLENRSSNAVSPATVCESRIKAKTLKAATTNPIPSATCKAQKKGRGRGVQADDHKPRLERAWCVYKIETHT